MEAERDFFFKEADVCSLFQASENLVNFPLIPTLLSSGCDSVVSGTLFDGTLLDGQGAERPPVLLLPSGPGGRGQSGLREAVVNFYRVSLCNRSFSFSSIPSFAPILGQVPACEILGAPFLD